LNGQAAAPATLPADGVLRDHLRTRMRRTASVIERIAKAMPGWTGTPLADRPTNSGKIVGKAKRTRNGKST